MAENESGLEKSEQPTERRLQQAREKGQTPRSRELTTFMVLMTGAIGLLFYGRVLIINVTDIAREVFGSDRALLLDPTRAVSAMFSLVLDMLFLLAPLLAALGLVALLGPTLLGGWIFAPENAMPKLEKLDPLKGLKRLFGLQGLMELLKAMGKFALVATGAVLLLRNSIDQILYLPFLTLESALQHGVELLAFSFAVLAALLLVIVAIDVPYQMWHHSNQLRMTRQELKDELKETEGQPEVKQRQRFLQREISLQRMIFEVPKADVVITNPTHYAVALKYEAESGAPRVIAKGVDEVALAIRAAARENDVTIVPAPPLARALYFSCQLNQQIPEGLYLAVAQVLAYVYQLEARVRGTRQRRRPTLPREFPIPEEYQVPETA